MALLKDRSVRGVALLDLAKFLRHLRKQRPLPPLSDAAKELLAGHLTPSAMYSLEAYVELLHVLDTVVVKGDEQAALEVGASGGSTFQGVLRAYVKPGDPRSSVMAMRHGWRAHYNFGVLSAEELGERAVHFRLADYPDVTMIHALGIAGWGLGAARAAGSKQASVDILERPWKGADAFAYVVHC